MSRLSKSRRIAEAYFRVSRSMGKWEEEAEAMDRLLQLAQSPVFEQYLLTPNISKDSKKRFLRDLLEAYLGTRIIGFLFFLLDVNAARSLGEILSEYKALILDSQGKVEVGLTTAERLKPEVKERIKKSMEKKLRKTVIFSENVNTGLLGGIVIAIRDKIYDASFKRRLRQLKMQMLRTG